jgi:hypothetical protein
MTVPHLFGMLGAAGAGGAELALPAAILALNPVGYWPLDDASAQFLNQGSVPISNGANNGGVSYAARSGPDGGLYPDFDYTNLDRIDINSEDEWSIGSGLTVFACWYFDVAPSAGHCMAAKLNFSGGYEWSVEYFTGNKVRYYKCSSNFGSSRIQTTTSTFAAATWHAVLVRFKGSAVTTADDVYVDSTSPVSIGTSTSGVGSASDTTSSMTIGGRQDDDGSPKPRWNGSLAHVAVFTGALSDSDAGDVMAAAQTDGWF